MFKPFFQVQAGLPGKLAGRSAFAVNFVAFGGIEGERNIYLVICLLY